ncbi:MAG: hypothetical protein RL172_1466 [Bacteroidota bacterium]|jgi:hypothetical protein
MSTNNTDAGLKKQAIIGGSTNAFTSGLLNWFSVKDKESLLLTDDLISSTKQTIFSGAVPSAVILAFLITSLTYFKFKKTGKPAYFPKVFFMALRHAVFAFGAVTIVAILIQRYFGSLTLLPWQSVLVVAIISGIIGGTVDYLTKRELV